MENKEVKKTAYPKICSIKDCLVIRLPEELDNYQTEKIRKETDPLFEEGRFRNVLFDFSRVSFMDSSAIGMIMGRYKKTKAFGGRVGVFGTGQRISRLLGLSGIQGLFLVFDSEKEAAEAFGIDFAG